MGENGFNWFTYAIAIIQILAGLLIIIFNRKLAPQKPISEDNKESQIPMTGIILIGLGDIILILFLVISYW
jgi:hypothetical protein